MPGMRRDDGEDDLEKAGRYDVAVLLKALDVLEALSDTGDLGLADIAARTGASKASVFRVLATLVGRGYVTKDPGTRRYSPGPRLVTIALATTAKIRLVPRARPILAGLRDEFGETANLGVLIETEVVYLEIAESSRSLRMSSTVGTRDGIHSTSLGKAILAALPVAEARGLLVRCDRRQTTRRTLTDLDALMADLRAIRSRGYSVDDEENEVGARCIGVAVTDVRGRPQAAISVSGPAARVADAEIEAIGERLMVAAEELAREMGWRGLTV